jgi:hypothetical protein
MQGAPSLAPSSIPGARPMVWYCDAGTQWQHHLHSGISFPVTSSLMMLLGWRFPLGSPSRCASNNLRGALHQATPRGSGVDHVGYCPYRAARTARGVPHQGAPCSNRKPFFTAITCDASCATDQRVGVVATWCS